MFQSSSLYFDAWQIDSKIEAADINFCRKLLNSLLICSDCLSWLYA